MKFLTSALLLSVALNASANNHTGSKANATTPVSSKPTTTIQTPKVTLTKDNVIVMNDYYDDEVVANVTAKAKALDAKLKSNDPLILVINSGGGSIDAGIELIENLNNLNRTVHTLTIFSASMGFQTVQGIKGKRLVLSNGTLMSHKARGMFYGEFPGQLDARYSYYLARVTRLDQIAAARTAGKHTLATYRALIENEYWCDGVDCLKQGFADTVVNAACDASLNGTYRKLYDRFLYMGHVIEIIDTMAECPLITAPLSWNVFIDGEPLFNNLTNLVEKEKPKENIEKESSSYHSSYRPYNESLKEKLGLETMENIKKLVTKKLDARKVNDRREVRKY